MEKTQLSLEENVLFISNFDMKNAWNEDARDDKRPENIEIASRTENSCSKRIF